MLFKLLSLPVTGPLDAVQWIGAKIHEAAEAQLNDTDAIKRELVALEKRLESGELSEAEFEEIELGLVKRLQEAAKRMKAVG
jgi:hypothetical protein